MDDELDLIQADLARARARSSALKSVLSTGTRGHETAPRRAPVQPDAQVRGDSSSPQAMSDYPSQPERSDYPSAPVPPAMAPTAIAQSPPTGEASHEEEPQTEDAVVAQLKETIGLLLGDLNRALLAKDKEAGEKQALFKDFVDSRKGSVQVLRLRDELEAQLRDQSARYEEELEGLHDRFLHDLDEAQVGKQKAVASVESSYSDALRRASARTEEVEEDLRKAREEGKAMLAEVAALKSKSLAEQRNEEELRKAREEASKMHSEISALKSKSIQADMEAKMVRGMLDDEKKANLKERGQATSQRNEAALMILRHEEQIRTLQARVDEAGMVQENETRRRATAAETADGHALMQHHSILVEAERKLQAMRDSVTPPQATGKDMSGNGRTRHSASPPIPAGSQQLFPLPASSSSPPFPSSSPPPLPGSCLSPYASSSPPIPPIAHPRAPASYGAPLSLSVGGPRVLSAGGAGGSALEGPRSAGAAPRSGAGETEMGVTVTIEGKGVRGGQEGPAGAWLGEALTAGLRVWPGRLLVVESVRTHAGDIAVEVVVGAAETIEDAAPAELCADLAILWAAFLRGEGAWAGPGHTGDPMRVAPAILDVQIHPPRAYPAQGTLRGVGDGEGEGGPLPRLLAVTVKHARALQECRGVGERVFAILRCAGGEAFRTSSVGLQSGPTFEQSAAARETQAMKGVALTVEVWSEGEGGGEDLAGSVNISAAKIADMAESGISFWFPLDAASPEAGPSILLAVTLALPSAPLPTAAMAPLPAARPPPLPGPASDPTSAGFGLRNHHPSGTASGGKQPASGVSGPAGRGTFGRKFGTQQAEGAAGGANKVAPVGETAARWNAVPSDLPEVRIDARDPLAPRGTVWSIAPLPEEGVFAVAGLGSEISVCRLEGAEWRRVRGLDGHDAPVLCVVACGAHQILSGGVDGTIGLWRAGQGGWEGEVECLGVHTAHDESISALIEVPGGLAVSGSADETVKIWRLGQSEDGPPLECIDTLSGHKGPISCLAVCQDAVLSGSLDKTIVVWERSTRPSLPQGSFAKTQVLREAKGVVASIAVFAAPASPGRMWVAAATGMGEIVVWEAGTWTVLHRFTGAHRKVIKMVCAPSPLDATLISADEKRVKVWDVSAHPWAVVKDIHVHEDDDQDQGPKDSICSLYIAPDKAVILAGNMFGTVAVCHTIE